MTRKLERPLEVADEKDPYVSLIDRLSGQQFNFRLYEFRLAQFEGENPSTP